jgi:predicted enzyme related to lactoylglutathione lyase
MDKVEHFEIPSDDPERALNFYKSVFGWELNPVPGVDYIRLLTIKVESNAVSGRPFEVNGAIVKRSREISGPVVTISVDDMDTALKKIADAGGSVLVGKTEFGTRGYTAYFKDTEGNVMGLWQVRRSPF